jgi:CheY-like chemotaxis protein
MRLSTGKILVMDNEDEVRRIMARMLRYHGNDVDEVSDELKLLEKFRETRKNGKPYDVVIIDLNVSDGMGAIDIMKILLREDPEVKAIISGGDADDYVITNYQHYGFRGVITKPYHYHKLITVVSNVINDVKT